MKKSILKIFVILTLVAIIALVPVMLTACDKQETDILQSFYGEYYRSEDRIVRFNFIPQEPPQNDYLGVPSGWDVVSVDEDSFTYIDSRTQQLAERACDAFVLKAMRKIMSTYGNTATLRKDEIYINDTETKIRFDTIQQNIYNEHNSIRFFYKKNIEIGTAHYVDIATLFYDTKGYDEFSEEDIALFVAIYDDYVIDEQGVEWEIVSSSLYKKLDV